MSDLFKRTQESLIKRRQNVIEGFLNSIPSPFKRFRKDFVGLEQGSYTIVTSFTKGGKTQFTLFLLFEALLYIMDHPEAADLKVFYFALEETDERILQRFESYLLNKLKKIRISPKALRSTYNDKPVPLEVLEALESEEFQKYIKAFEEHFIFSTVANPTGIYLQCKKYAEEHGIVTNKSITLKNEFGEEEEIRAFDYYTQDNPHEFRVVVVDHCGLLKPEKGASVKETIDQLSKHFVELRNRYNFSPILIQQQSTINESNDSIKINNIRPNGRGLSDSSYTQRDCQLLLGLFSPFRFNIDTYKGYDIKRFRDHIRFLEVCNSRDGEVGGMVALFFDGCCGRFYELPLPDDPAINDWYNYLTRLRD